MKYLKLSCLLLISAFTFISCISPDDPVMRELVKRIIPNQEAHFRFEMLKDTTNDVFELESEGNKIIIRGNNRNSMAVGLNHYLKNYCLTTVSWHSDEPVEMPEILPSIPEKIRIPARVQKRFFLNYCTFGYTMPWWKWAEWERFIDWMALNGVNMPLAITGQEAIWYRVWKKLGLTDEEIRNYFVGPAHLPWQRMSNLDYWQGPLPKDWLDQQEKLQQQIVVRERELNMTPILPAFAGHVPQGLKRLYPNAQITRVSEWGGFADRYRCSFLNPMDSLFSIIQNEFLKEQTRLFGSDHIYGADPFNEIDPPSWNTDSLAYISKHIYESMADFDPEATWLQMGWLFYADSKNWNDKNIKAYLQAVPQDKLIMLDYFCEYTEIWKQTQSFYGQPYIWCYLGNFGGNTMLSGNLKTVGERIENAIRNGGQNLQGLGSTLEGFGVNQFVYEYILDKAWNLNLTDSLWIGQLADRQIGKKDPNARAAWQILYDKVYVQPAQVGQGTLTNAHPALEGNWHWTTKPTIEYRYQDLWQAWSQLLDVENCRRNTYIFDVVNLGRQVLGDYFLIVRDQFTEAYRKKDLSALESKGKEMIAILTDIDRLTSCHPAFSLDKWLKTAREFGKDTITKNYYETNARTLITVWGDSYHLTDYANRSWAGLTSSYYTPRWQMFIDQVIEAVKTRQAFDQKKFDEGIAQFERRWIDPTQQTLSPTVPGDALKIAQEIVTKYKDKIKTPQ